MVGTVDYEGNGASGLEYQYQSLLAGRPGTKSLLVSPDGVALPGDTSRDVAARPGVGIELTLDESVQYVAEQALAAEIVAAHSTGGTAIVMDVKTGDILAMADLAAAPPGSAAAPASPPVAGTPSGPSSCRRPTPCRPGSKRPRPTRP